MVIKKMGLVLGFVLMMYVFGFVSSVFALDKIKVPVDLDNKAPVLTDFDYLIKHKKVTFNFEIEEDNFKEVYYRDVADCNRKFIKYNTLCRRISSSGKCFAVRDLCIGEHHMEITIVDKAKNSFTTEVFDFSIV